MQAYEIAIKFIINHCWESFNFFRNLSMITTDKHLRSLKILFAAYCINIIN